MRLLGNWKQVIRHAWSVRLIAFAAILSGAEVFLSIVSPGWLGLPPGTFAILSGAVSMLAFAARIIAQENVDG